VVKISENLTTTPALVRSQISSSMMLLMAMSEKNPERMKELHKNLTLEINPNHDLIVKLNRIRKNDQKIATLVARQVLDMSLINAKISN